MKKYITMALFGVFCLMILFLQFQYKKTYQPHTYYQVYLDDKIVGVIESKNQLEEYIGKQGQLIKNQVLQYDEELEILKGIDSIIENKIKKYSNRDQYLEMTSAYNELLKLVDEEGKFSSAKKETVEELIEVFSIQGVTVANDFIRNYAFFKEQLEESFQEKKAIIVDYIEKNKDKLSLSEAEQFYLESYQSKNLENVSYAKQKYMENYVEKNMPYVYTDNVYSPIGIHVEKINTYYANLSTVDEVYQAIVKEKPCTIEGYQFRIKKPESQVLSKYSYLGGLFFEGVDYLLTVPSEDVIVYVTEESVFKDAVEKLEIVFVGSEQYEKYKGKVQEEIVDTGSKVEDVYILEDITIKKTNVSVGEKIYNDADELSSFLLYGEDKSIKTVYASTTDDVFSITEKNGVSVEEFFLSNPSFTSVYNMFYENQPIVIAQTNPQISVVVEKFVVEDMEVDYKTEERYDSQLNKGVRYVEQKGVKGLHRVSQDVKSINGAASYVKPAGSVILKNVKNEIVLIGTKEVPNVGSLGSWYWPTNQGYRITSYYGYRTSPINGRRELHTGLDIAGTGYGSPVYASNNGTITYMKSLKYSYGNHIIINHNNGYYSLYGHMSRFAPGLTVGSTVSRGQVIGYVGSSGAATGPHLHFEIRNCDKYYGCFLNPLTYLRK